jgi:hypothetical protein
MTANRTVTFEELVGRALAHAEDAEAALAEEERRLEDHSDDGRAKANTLAQLREVAGIHASLAEAYARLGSAVIVNATSLRVPSAEPGHGPRPS